MGGRLRREVVTESGKEVPGAPATSELVSVTVTFGESSLPPVFLAFSPALEAALEEPSEEAQPEAAPRTDTPAALESGVPTAAGSLSVTQSSKTLDLLMEVELPVSVSFGRARLLLKDVLKLNTGSIVELNRAVSEPVEVIVNNCVIARGEVVVLEGNYGVRINQIISRQDRLRTLK